MPHALVTGAAGFIGSHLVDSLLAGGWQVTGVDNFDPFYPEPVKLANLARALAASRFTLIRADIRDFDAIRAALNASYDVIVHLAAKAGVRPSIQHPQDYQLTNVNGTQNLLDVARLLGVRQFVFASSSSVYGVNPNVPWREDDHVLRPISPYASTKVSGELLGHVYSHLYGIRFLALRFFTVYGPRQRPDLAIHKFAHLIRTGKPVPFFGDGSTRRDYTFVGDIIAGIRAAMAYSASTFEVINLGNCRTITLAELVASLELVLNRKAILDYQPEQPGDVPQTCADISKAQALLGYQPQTEFLAGLRQFASWLAESTTY
jgi:UDP-glucuronate 4-epimerase